MNKKANARTELIKIASINKEAATLMELGMLGLYGAAAYKGLKHLLKKRRTRKALIERANKMAPLTKKASKRHLAMDDAKEALLGLVGRKGKTGKLRQKVEDSVAPRFGYEGSAASDLQVRREMLAQRGKGPKTIGQTQPVIDDYDKSKIGRFFQRSRAKK